MGKYSGNNRRTKNSLYGLSLFFGCLYCMVRVVNKNKSKIMKNAITFNFNKNAEKEKTMKNLTRQQAETNCKRYNKSLSEKAYHKYFKVVVCGPKNNYSVVSFKEAKEMNLNYSVFN